MTSGWPYTLVRTDTKEYVTDTNVSYYVCTMYLYTRICIIHTYKYRSSDHQMMALTLRVQARDMRVTCDQ